MKPILMLFIFVPILAFILITLNILLSTNKPDDSKISPFECGFLTLTGQTRTNFDIQFYLVAVLFLVFDLEILLIFPAAVSLYQISFFGFAMLIIFFLVLTVGFVLEIGSGAIKLQSTKIISSSKEKEINNLTPFLNKQIISPMLIKQQKATFSTSAVYSKENLKDITTKFLLGNNTGKRYRTRNKKSSYNS
jgi:NADH-ubiquinone oxidoreductase chain 3